MYVELFSEYLRIVILHMFSFPPNIHLFCKVDYQTFNSPRDYWDKVIGKVKEFSAIMIEVRPLNMLNQNNDEHYTILVSNREKSCRSGKQYNFEVHGDSIHLWMHG